VPVAFFGEHFLESGGRRMVGISPVKLAAKLTRIFATIKL